MFDAKKNVDLVGEHFGLVLDQTLVDDLDGTSLLSLFVDAELDSRKVTTTRAQRANQIAKKERTEGVSVCDSKTDSTRKVHLRRGNLTSSLVGIIVVRVSR